MAKNLEAIVVEPVKVAVEVAEVLLKTILGALKGR